MTPQPHSKVAFGSAAKARRRRSIDRLDRIRDQLTAEAHIVERETWNAWPIEAATALRDAGTMIADAIDLIEAVDG